MLATYKNILKESFQEQCRVLSRQLFLDINNIISGIPYKQQQEFLNYASEEYNSFEERYKNEQAPGPNDMDALYNDFVTAYTNLLLFAERITTTNEKYKEGFEKQNFEFEFEYNTDDEYVVEK